MSNAFSKFMKYSIPGLLDSAVGAIGTQVIGGAVGMVSGLGAGLVGKSLKYTNSSVLGNLGKTIGYGVGAVGSLGAKPVMHAGKKILGHTPKDINHFSKLLTGTFGLGFKKAGKNSTHSLFGYEARAGTGWALAGGAVGLGALSGTGQERYNLGLKTAVNGIMDTEGVALTPGVVNQSYTPVYNHGATGQLGLELHKRRNTGYL